MKLKTGGFKIIALEELSNKERVDYYKVFSSSLPFSKNGVNLSTGTNNFLATAEKLAIDLLNTNKQHKNYYFSQRVVENCKLIKYKSVLANWFKKLPSQTGTFIVSPRLCFRYSIIENEDISVMTHVQRNEPGRGEMEYFFVSNIPLENSKRKINMDEDENQSEYMMLFTQLMLFKTYANVKFHTLAPSAKTLTEPKLVGPDAYTRNETTIPLTYVNILWDRTIIVAGEFKVRGHFRIQPFGSLQNPDYKLIWIDEYKKEGYTRVAGKIKDEQNGN